MVSSVETETIRRRMSGAARREQILDVARAIVAAENFHAATPARVAAEAGVHRSVIYQHFGDPSGMFVAMIDREVATATAGFQAAIRQARDTPDRAPISVVFDGVLAAVDDDPQTWRLFLFPPLGAPPELHARLETAQRAVEEFLAAALVRYDPDVHDPELAARVLHAIGRELLQQRLTDPDSMTADRIRDFTPNALLDLRRAR